MSIKPMLLCTSILASSVVIAFNQSNEPSHGIPYINGWQNWAVIAASHRTDNNTMRTIIGNDVAVKAARSGNISPWPDGAILGKLVWKAGALKSWKDAVVPDEFVHAEFMLKNAKKYTSTHGWGWARWSGMEQSAFNKGPQICISCHTPVKDKDWVFTEPAKFPNTD